MSFTAGDLSHNISKIMQDFVKAEKEALRTVNILSSLHSDILMLDIACGTGQDSVHGWAYDKWKNRLVDLRKFCLLESDLILKVFPCLKDPLADFLKDCPYDMSDEFEEEFAYEFEEEQNEVFMDHLFQALQSL